MILYPSFALIPHLCSIHFLNYLEESKSAFQVGVGVKNSEKISPKMGSELIGISATLNKKMNTIFAIYAVENSEILFYTIFCIAGPTFYVHTLAPKIVRSSKSENKFR